MSDAKPEVLQIDMSRDMVEQVMTEFERDNPGLTFNAMDEKEFGRRMMAKIKASARIIEGGSA